MPGYKGHMAGALSAWGLMLLIVLMWQPAGGIQALEWAVIAIIGGMFPDLDIKSMGQKLIYRVLFAVALVLLAAKQYQVMAIILPISLFPLLVKHRGVMHTWWFITAVPVVAATLLSLSFPVYKYIIITDALFFWAGAASHLWLDFNGINKAEKLAYKILAAATICLCCYKCYSWAQDSALNTDFIANNLNWVKSFYSSKATQKTPVAAKKRTRSVK